MQNGNIAEAGTLIERARCTIGPIFLRCTTSRLSSRPRSFCSRASALTTAARSGSRSLGMAKSGTTRDARTATWDACEVRVYVPAHEPHPAMAMPRGHARELTNRLRFMKRGFEWIRGVYLNDPRRDF